MLVVTQYENYHFNFTKDFYFLHAQNFFAHPPTFLNDLPIVYSKNFPE